MSVPILKRVPVNAGMRGKCMCLQRGQQAEHMYREWGTGGWCGSWCACLSWYECAFG